MNSELCELNSVSITFNHIVTTAQLELKEADWWGKHHQKWPENGLVSLKSGVFVPSAGRRPYQGSNYAFCARRVKGHVSKVMCLG